MAQSIAPMQLFVSIVERGMEHTDREKYYRVYGLYHHMQVSNSRTAASHLLDTFGFSTAGGSRSHLRHAWYHPPADSPPQG